MAACQVTVRGRRRELPLAHLCQAGIQMAATASLAAGLINGAEV